MSDTKLPRSQPLPKSAARSVAAHGEQPTRRSFLAQLTAAGVLTSAAVSSPAEEAFTAERQRTVGIRDLGFKLVQVPAGTFQMGQADGAWDERVVHRVTLTRGFAMSATQITNAQYELYDPNHKRGQHISTGDDEAVVNVTYSDAVGFTRWLSEREGKSYRLPTEAEWEYAARAGTLSVYPTGDVLPPAYWKYQQPTALGGDRFWGFSLAVGQTPPNQFGLFDMLGNVEEWCLDWYGMYGESAVHDPTGPTSGYLRVTRGGSFAANLNDLRPAKRLSALPADGHEKLGFRVVEADLNERSSGAIFLAPGPEQSVSQHGTKWISLASQPMFSGPRVYVKIPPNSDGPLFSAHNHFPSIVYCDNGDLIATWYTCDAEDTRNLYTAFSRLRKGSSEWDNADLFFAVPGRNAHSAALAREADGTLCHFQGVGSDSFQTKQIMVFRKSRDNGASWSLPEICDANRRMLNPHFVLRHSSGALLMTSDFNLDEPLRGELLVSQDSGTSWRSAGPRITGQHPPLVELKDGSVLIAGRTNNKVSFDVEQIEGPTAERTSSSTDVVTKGYVPDARLPLSITSDLGRTWSYRRSELPAVSWGQRAVLMRLLEGPILFVGFTDADGFTISEIEARFVNNPQGGMIFRQGGSEYKGFGLFAAVSYDEGQTWPVRRLITAGGEAKAYDGGGNTHLFLMDREHAEPRGYLNGLQTPDGVIQLLSSRLHYQFNLAWLEEHGRG